MVDSTCPHCGSHQVYNSGFRIECPTVGCANFSKAQLQAAAPVYNFQSGDFILERGKSYWVTCKTGLANCYSVTYSAMGQSEKSFTLKTGNPYLIRMEEDGDYQACVRLISGVDNTTVVVEGVIKDLNNPPKDLVAARTLEAGQSFDLVTQ